MAWLWPPALLRGPPPLVLAVATDVVDASPARVVTSLEVPVLGSVGSTLMEGAVLLPPSSESDEKSPSTGEAIRSATYESAGCRFRIPCRLMVGLPGALPGLVAVSIRRSG